MHQSLNLALIFGMPGWGEILLLAVVGLLIFGKRLPEVGRSLGRGILEFKKGISGIDPEIDSPKAHEPPAIGSTKNPNPPQS